MKKIICTVFLALPLTCWGQEPEATAAVPAGAEPAAERSVDPNSAEGLTLQAIRIFRSGEKETYPEGITLLESAAKKDYAPALEWLGRIHLQGEVGLKPDPEKASGYFKKAAAFPGAVDANYWLGLMAAQGIGRDADSVEAVQLMQSAANSGSVQAMLALANLYIRGKETEVDYQAAMRYCSMAAEKGSSEGVYRLGILHENYLPGAPNLEKAIPYYREAAKKGSGPANFRLAQLAEAGKLDGEAEDEKYDDEKVFRLYRASGVLGHGPGAFGVAAIYGDKKSNFYDPIASLAWLKRGAQLGDAMAQNAYGNRLLVGNEGAVRDLAEAYKWFSKSADQGLPAGIVNTAVFLLDEKVEPTDQKKGFEMLQSAAESGFEGAFVAFSNCCRQGLGMAKPDLVKASVFLNLAANSNDSLKEEADKFSAELSAEQKAQVAKEVAEWQAKFEKKDQ